jgi:mRNA interferase RelE/StbE
MAYTVEITSKARKQFSGLPQVVKPQVADTINALADDPRPPQSIRLEDTPGYRVRTGDYRVLYTIDDKAKRVTVYRVQHRRDVYRGR